MGVGGVRFGSGSWVVVFGVGSGLVWSVWVSGSVGVGSLRGGVRFGSVSGVVVSESGSVSVWLWYVGLWFWLGVGRFRIGSGSSLVMVCRGLVRIGFCSGMLWVCRALVSVPCGSACVWGWLYPDRGELGSGGVQFGFGSVGLLFCYGVCLFLMGWGSVRVWVCRCRLCIGFGEVRLRCCLALVLLRSVSVSHEVGLGLCIRCSCVGCGPELRLQCVLQGLGV